MWVYLPQEKVNRKYLKSEENTNRGNRQEPGSGRWQSGECSYFRHMTCGTLFDFLNYTHDKKSNRNVKLK